MISLPAAESRVIAVWKLAVEESANLTFWPSDRPWGGDMVQGGRWEVVMAAELALYRL